ncbi:MAG: dihydrofolate reductase family protein [Planctomycetaceae bacterium]|nr:dihydrofolate reductase family protein [Planctomycetaceae bacterium]
MTNDTPQRQLDRPHVTLNVAETVDGKIALVDRGKISIGGPEDREQMERLRTEADAVLIGGGTLVSEDPPLLIHNEELQSQRLAAKGARHPRNVTVCTTLPAHLAEMKFFRHPDTEKIVFTTRKSSPDLLRLAAQFAQVELVELNAAGKVNLTEILSRLRTLGVRRLLLEGGGELNFSMFDAGCVDEMYITVCPFVFGGRAAPTPVDGVGFPLDGIRKLALKSHRVGARGEVFLRYAVLSEPPLRTPSSLFANGVQLG